MRAVFCASFAARRKARPTPAAKLIRRVVFARVFAFMDRSPINEVSDLSCRTPPSCPPAAGRCVESSPNLVGTYEEHQLAARHDRPAALGRQFAAVPIELNAVEDTLFRCGSQLASKTALYARRSTR